MFGWTYIDGNGEEAGASARFDDREAAEDWIGQTGQGLADLGIMEVVLRDHHRGSTIYRMGLAGVD